MNKPQSNAKQVQISSANKIDVARLLEKYMANKTRLHPQFYTEPDERDAIKDHQNTLETIFTALNVPIPQ